MSPISSIHVVSCRCRVQSLKVFFALAGSNDASPADAFPDPAGRHPQGPAVLFGLCHRVCGRGGVVVRHEVAVVGHKVAPQLTKVLNRVWQEELHPAEDVQQRLRSAKEMTWCLKFSADCSKS